MSEFVIVTDSACDIKPEMLKEWGVLHEPLTFRFNDSEAEYADGSVDIKEFYDKMRAGGVAKTAAVNVETFSRRFEEPLKNGVDVLYLGFFWILLDEKNRAWHDKILDTYVVDLHGTRALEAKAAPAKTQPAPASPAPAPKAETPAPEAVAAAPKEDETPAVEAKVPEMKAAEPKTEVKAPEVRTEAKVTEVKAAEPAPAVEVETEVAEAPSAEAADQTPKVEAKAPEVKAAEPKAVPAQDVKVSMSMKKDELLEAAYKA
jgi:pyruvate/2-oxoglutarate dehydrogenase complex dihydrolipoamide acyltransferase (E2) component